jgi:YggT family protein
MVLSGVFAILSLIAWALFVLLLFRIVFDLVQSLARSWTPHGPLLVALEGLYTVTDPPVRVARRTVPPLRLGNFGVDLGFLVLLIATQILRVLFVYLANRVGA